MGARAYMKILEVIAAIISAALVAIVNAKVAQVSHVFLHFLMKCALSTASQK